MIHPVTNKLKAAVHANVDRSTTVAAPTIIANQNSANAAADPTKVKVNKAAKVANVKSGMDDKIKKRVKKPVAKGKD